MSEPTYRQAVSFAGRVVASNPLVWLFGLLSLGVGQFGLNDFFGQLLALSSQSVSWSIVSIAWPASLSGSALWWFAWLLVFLIPFVLFIIFIAVAGQGALMALVIDSYRHHSDDVERAWHKGVRHFWRLLGIQVLKKAVFVLLFIAMAALLNPFFGSFSLGASLTRALIVLVSFLVALFLASVVIFASGYIIQDNLSIGAALRRGADLWRRHILVSLEIGLLSVVANIVLIILIINTQVITAIPSALFTLLGLLTHQSFLIVVGVYLGSILTFAFVGILAALCNALITSAWMYLFMKMHHEGVTSRFRLLIRHAFGTGSSH